MKSPLPTFFRQTVDSYTKLLLHCDGSDGSQVFVDSSASGHIITAYGNAQQDEADKKFGNASVLFDGAGDYLSIPIHADFNFGAGDFTIDLWIKRNTTGNQVIFGSWVPGPYPFSGGYYLYFAADNKVIFSADCGPTTPTISSTGTIINDDIWHHLAVVRNGSSWKIYIDGSNDGSTTDSNAIDDITVPLHIGSYFYGDFNGLIDEVRFSKGIARWTSNFTPPTRAY